VKEKVSIWSLSALPIFKKGLKLSISFIFMMPTRALSHHVFLSFG